MANAVVVLPASSKVAPAAASRLQPALRQPEPGSMRSNRLCGVVPALVAGHLRLPCGLSARKTWMAGTGPAMTANKMVQYV
jgi:hypothetical protein